ncbi:MAG TPA: hypothetical protein VM370_03755 [Candidatus Thermoplasmatota archaeon]|nr:hypothetical protein [Candidatus Thermoplasmatota archaeon]
MRLPLAGIAMALLLAGCNAPGENADDGPTTTTPTTTMTTPPVAGSDSCGARYAGPHGENALPISSLQDDPDVVMQRLADAVGDPPVGSPEANESGMSWQTQGGRLELETSGAWRVASYAPRGQLAGDMAALLENVLTTFYVPPEVHREGAEAWNEFQGARVNGTSAFARPNRVVVGPLYEWGPHASALDDATLEEKAREAADCVAPGAKGAIHKEQLDVVDDSLVWSIRAEGDACAIVKLDMQTGGFVDGEPCE